MIWHSVCLTDVLFNFISGNDVASVMCVCLSVSSVCLSQTDALFNLISGKDVNSLSVSVADFISGNDVNSFSVLFLYIYIPINKSSLKPHRLYTPKNYLKISYVSFSIKTLSGLNSTSILRLLLLIGLVSDVIIYRAFSSLERAEFHVTRK